MPLVAKTMMKPAAFEIMLEWIYTDKVPQNLAPTLLCPLLEGANFWQLGGLKTLAAIGLCRDLTVDNVSKRLVLADQTESVQLKEACLSFVAANAAAVMASPCWADVMASGAVLINETMTAVVSRVNPKKRKADKAELDKRGSGIGENHR